MGKQKQRNLWESPWGYVESFIIGLGLLIAGFALEISMANNSVITLVFPYNLVALLTYCSLLIIAYKWLRNYSLIKWLSKVPAAITSICLVTFMVLIMGIIPQVPSENTIVNSLGLNHITTNWAFIFIIIVFLSNLGLVTIKYIFQFKKSNNGFILSHLGLFIALTSGLFGSGDLQRLTITTKEGEPSWIAQDNQNNDVELPFAFYLNKFTLEEYPPKLALIDNESGDLYFNNGENLYLIEKEKSYVFGDYNILVYDYLTSAGRIGERYAFVNELGSPPAAYVEVEDVKADSIVKGWISCGSFAKPPQSLKVNQQLSLVMTIPEVKKYTSEITILTKDEGEFEANLEVNQPYNFRGWEIYQYSYDETFGKWSNISILELVRDPWLPYIYFGIFMMIGGAIYMFWVGNVKIKAENNDLD